MRKKTGKSITVINLQYLFILFRGHCIFPIETRAPMGFDARHGAVSRRGNGTEKRERTGICYLEIIITNSDQQLPKAAPNRYFVPKFVNIYF